MRRLSIPMTDGRHSSTHRRKKEKEKHILQTFAELELRDVIRKNLAAADHVTPTEIQALALPQALSGRDLIACAQTGGGKTAVFALPILNKLTHSDSRNPRALILVPTRELAVQVEAAFAPVRQRQRPARHRHLRRRRNAPADHETAPGRGHHCRHAGPPV